MSNKKHCKNGYNIKLVQKQLLSLTESYPITRNKSQPKFQSVKNERKTLEKHMYVVF